MKKAVLLGERKAGLVEVPDPEPAEDWVVVKVHAAPMCTEYKSFLAGRKEAFLGHEAAGEVAAVARPGRVKAGDRVVVMPLSACGKCSLCVAGDYIHCGDKPDIAALTGSREGSATMAQYLLKPSWLLPPIPEGVSYEHASLACCALGPSFGAFDLMRVDAFDTVLITGAGPVGLGAVVNATFRGARAIVVEARRARMELAKHLGAETAIDPASEGIVGKIRDLTGGKGVDKAVECSGVVGAERLCIEATRRKGSVAFVGECPEDLPVKVSPDLIRKGLTLHGSWHYNLSLFPKVMRVIRSSPVIDRLITHVLPMSDIQQAMELSASTTAGKIVLKPWE